MAWHRLLWSVGDYLNSVGRHAIECAAAIVSSNAYAMEVAVSDIAKMAASVDTLDGFLREMKVRFPDALARAPLPPETKDVVSTGALPTIPRGLKPAAAR